MAKFFPSLSQIQNLRPKPQEGEWYLLQKLSELLDDDSYEVYFQVFLNGDRPDIVVMRPGSGLLIIEVKDWRLKSYYVDERGNWRIKNNDARTKSPMAQVQGNKDNLFSLHIPGLLEKKVRNEKLLAVVSCAVYFQNESEQKVRVFCENDPNFQKPYSFILGLDSLTPKRFSSFLNDTWLGKQSIYFTDVIAKSIRRYLQPTRHTLEEGIPITYTDKQKRLIQSDSKQIKIAGVAGSGKTLVLAARAVNAHIRTGNRMLILTFNISLRNYIHDRISEVRQEFEWSNFYIVHYHLFFRIEANNHNLEITSFLDDADNVEFFESVKDKITKYDAVFIDEIQDYKSQWIRLIKKYFLSEGGEFVVFGDEKQNVYARQLEKDRKPNTTIPGAWNKLDDSYRLPTRLAQLAQNFQGRFLQQKYDVDKINIIQQLSLFSVQESINYIFLPDVSIGDIASQIKEELLKLGAHPNDIAIIGSSIESLRNIDLLWRQWLGEHTTTTFETQEEWEDFSIKLSEKELKETLEEIRRNRKFQFQMNTGLMKISSIHSFKGWEISTLVVLIPKNDEVGEEATSTDELIYTGITRCRQNLIIVNNGNITYNSFFNSYRLQPLL